MQNFQAITESLVSREGALSVANAEELEQAVARLLADESYAQKIGRNGQQVVRENLGSIERTVDMIIEYLSANDVFVARER